MSIVVNSNMEFGFINKFNTRGKLKNYKNAKANYLKKIRWSVSVFYFAMGLCSATWASRIPDLKNSLQMSEAMLGSVLFAIPLGQLIAMTFSGKIITKFGSKNVLLTCLVFYALLMVCIGFSANILQLSVVLFMFGVFGNLCNISVNTQGVYTERLYRKTIMSSFHGAWSIAGFTGALIGLLMLGFNLAPTIHFAVVFALVIVLMVLHFNQLIVAKEKKNISESTSKTKYDATIIWLGIIGFCCMASEGIMFDWSGVYFSDVVKAPGALVILGYTSFMIMMAMGRFMGDGLIRKFGRKKVTQISGLMISGGLFLAVIFPNLYVAVFSFMIVGLGVSTIIPTVYSLAGQHPNIPAGEALTMVSSVSFLGFLIGPPIIGFVAELFGLQMSFAIIGLFGVLITLLVTKLKVLNF